MPESKSTEYHTNSKQKTMADTTPMSNLERSQSTELKSPEEEIDSAFEIIDKVDIYKWFRVDHCGMYVHK